MKLHCKDVVNNQAHPQSKDAVNTKQHLYCKDRIKI